VLMTAANVAPGAGKRSVRPLIQLLALHQQSLMLDLKLSSYPAPRMDHSPSSSPDTFFNNPRGS
jgi:hypothetical protein